MESTDVIPGIGTVNNLEKVFNESLEETLGLKKRDLEEFIGIPQDPLRTYTQ
jgi:hypothetical protein